MNESELERMVVRLVGDGASFQSMMQSAQIQSAQVGQQLNSLAGNVTSLTSSVGNLASGVVAAIGAFGLKSWIDEARSAYGEQIKSERNLNAMLVANGRDVEMLFERYRTFSEEMQRQTGIADENVLSLLQQAEAYGATGAAAERAVQNFIAAEGRIPLRGGLRALTLLEDPSKQHEAFQMLHRSFPTANNVGEIQERLSRLFAVAQEDGKRASVQLKVAWSEMLEEFGKSIHEMGKPLIEAKLLIVNWVRSWSPEVKQAITTVAMLLTTVTALYGVWKILTFTAALFSPTILAVIGVVALLGVVFSSLRAPAGAAADEWGQIPSAVKNAWESLVDSEAGKAVRQFVDDNRDMVAAVVASGFAIAGLVVAYKVLAFTVGLVVFLADLLYIKQLVGLGIWALWKIAVLAVNAVWFIYNAQVALYTVLITTGFGATLLFSGAVAVAKFVMWLFALATGAATGGVTLLTGAVAVLAGGLALLGTAILFGGGLIVLVAAAYAAYKALGAVLDVLSVIPTTSGPLAAIGDVFKEWGGIIVDIVRGTTVSLPLTWNLMKAGFNLAVSQIKDLWPPLWTFLREGFTVVWELIASVFAIAFRNTLASILNQVIGVYNAIALVARTISPGLNLPLLGAIEPSAGNIQNEVNRAQERLLVLTGRFRVDESQETRDARAEVDAARVALERERQRQQGRGGGGNEPREIQKIDAVLFSGAEAAFRVQQQFLRFGQQRTDPRQQALNTLVAQGADANQLRQRQLEQLRRAADNPPVVVRPANI